MKKLGIFFGGIATEHEVSIITALQLIKNINNKKYQIIPIYVDKAGKWWTGEKTTKRDNYKKQDLAKPKGFEVFEPNLLTLKDKLDVAILCFHGNYGEGGNFQGLLELAQIPYQGPELLSSSLAMDKISSRLVLKAANFPQPDFIYFDKNDWEKNKNEILEKIKKLTYPVFLKPSRSGSSIGVVRISNAKELEKQLPTAFKLDNRILVEAAITDCLEVNVSVLGDQNNAQASITEEPIKSEELLSFADKYEKGGGKKSGMASATRRIPAPISSNLSQKLQAAAIKIFKLFDCSGVVRIDFFANPSTEDFYVIEINTIPGSMSFYLWEKTNLTYPKLIDKLVVIAENNFTRKQALTTTFENNILK